MSYALVCDSLYKVDVSTGAYVCEGVSSQMVIDPLVSIDAAEAAKYLSAGFGVALMVFSVAWSARQLVNFVYKS